LFSIDVRFLEKVNIDQSEVIIERVSKIAVTEDEFYIFPDNKAGNIKIFNSKGKLEKIWGQKGMGPGDFSYPLFCDYKKPYFALMDWGKYKLMLFERKEHLNFKKLQEVYILALAYDIKIYGQNVLIAGYKKDNITQNKYQLYLLNILKNKIDYLLPIHIKYGCDSIKKYEKDYLDKYAPIGIEAFFDYYGDKVYYSWEGNLRIIKIDMNSKKMEFFGKKTKNYITPKVTPKLRKMRREKSNKMYTERQKMSYVTGILADSKFVSLTYATYNHENKLWVTFIQFYKPNGLFLFEKPLEGAVNATRYEEPSLFFSKEKSILYFLSRAIDKEFNDVFKILKYKITN